MTAIEAIKTEAATKSTETLLGALMIMDANGGPKDPAEHMVQCAIGGTVERRNGLTKVMDLLYWENLDNVLTYSQALRLALIANDVARELDNAQAVA